MPLDSSLASKLEQLEGARARSREDERLPGLVVELDGPWNGPGLALLLTKQEGFGVACFKQFPDFLEAIVTDYRDGSNANVFASEQELIIFPGFSASKRFFADLINAVSTGIGVGGLHDWEQTKVEINELFVSKI